MSEHLEHDAPVIWLTRKLHAGTSLQERVRVMRARRWRKEACIEMEERQQEQLEQQQQQEHKTNENQES